MSIGWGPRCPTSSILRATAARRSLSALETVCRAVQRFHIDVTVIGVLEQHRFAVNSMLLPFSILETEGGFPSGADVESRQDEIDGVRLRIGEALQYILKLCYIHHLNLGEPLGNSAMCGLPSSSGGGT